MPSSYSGKTPSPSSRKTTPPSSGKTRKMSRSPPVKASPLTLDILKKMESQARIRKREWLKSKHTEVTDILEQLAAEVRHKLLDPKNVRKFPENFKEYRRARNDVEESKKQEFGHGRTYPDHPAPGELYIVIKDLNDNPEYRAVLLRLFRDRISNSKISRFFGNNKRSAEERIKHVVGFKNSAKYDHDNDDPLKGYLHPELIRKSRKSDFRRSGGSKTKKSGRGKTIKGGRGKTIKSRYCSIYGHDASIPLAPLKNTPNTKCAITSLFSAYAKLALEGVLASTTSKITGRYTMPFSKTELHPLHLQCVSFIK